MIVFFDILQDSSVLTVNTNHKLTHIISYLLSTEAFFNKHVSQLFARQAGARLKFRPPCNCLAHTRTAVLGSMCKVEGGGGGEWICSCLACPPKPKIPPKPKPKPGQVKNTFPLHPPSNLISTQFSPSRIPEYLPSLSYELDRKQPEQRLLSSSPPLANINHHISL